MRPPLDLTTLVDCGCKTRVYADGSGVEIDYCPKHRAAPDLLELCEYAYEYFARQEPPHLQLGKDLTKKLRQAIDKAKGNS